MATVWKDTRTHGRPIWCISFKGLDNRWHRERTEAQSKEQAQRLLRARLSDLAEAKERGLQTLERRKPTPFAQFVDEDYMTSKAPPARRKSTHDRDQDLYRNVKPAFGSMLLGAVTTADVEKYLARRKTGKTCRGTPPSKAQLNRERQFLSSVFGMAKRWGLIDRNPVEDVKKLREDNARDRVLSHEEESDILKVSPGFLVPIIRIAVNTGMRLGEILEMKWSDVDRKDGGALLGGFIRVGSESKVHRSRHVPINPVVKAALDAQKPIASKDGFVPHVFANPTFQKPFKVTSVSNTFRAAANRARVTDASFHTLRHTAVSRMVAAGIPDRIIMKIVGHTTSAMVSRYAHLAPDNLKGATDCLAGKDRTPVVQNGSPRGVSGARS